jgi:hypothetical protein
VAGKRIHELVSQTAKTGSPMEFGTIQETIAPVALQTIGDWIQATAKPRKSR